MSVKCINVNVPEQTKPICCFLLFKNLLQPNCNPAYNSGDIVGQWVPDSINKPCRRLISLFVKNVLWHLLDYCHSFFVFLSLSFRLSLPCPGHPPPPPSAPLANERSKTLQWLMSTKRQDPSVISPPCVFSQAANSSKTAHALLADGNGMVSMEVLTEPLLLFGLALQRNPVRRHFSKPPQQKSTLVLFLYLLKCFRVECSSFLSCFVCSSNPKAHLYRD